MLKIKEMERRMHVYSFHERKLGRSKEVNIRPEGNWYQQQDDAASSSGVSGTGRGGQKAGPLSSWSLAWKLRVYSLQ